MTTPRGAKHRDLEQRFRDLERQVQELSTATLRRKRLSVTQGDFVISGGGDLKIKDGTGAVVFSALDGPVKVSQVHQQDTNYALSTNGHTVSANITVPAGYTKVFAFGSVSTRARNTRGVNDYFYVSGTDALTDVPAGMTGHLSWSNVSVSTGLTPGSTFTSSFVVCAGGAGWGTDTMNSATLSCLYVWQR